MVVVLEFDPASDDDVPMILHDVLDAMTASPTRAAKTHVAIGESADRIVAEFEH